MRGIILRLYKNFLKMLSGRIINFIRNKEWRSFLLTLNNYEYFHLFLLLRNWWMTNSIYIVSTMNELTHLLLCSTVYWIFSSMKNPLNFFSHFSLPMSVFLCGFERPCYIVITHFSRSIHYKKFPICHLSFNFTMVLDVKFLFVVKLWSMPSLERFMINKHPVLALWFHFF